MSKNNIAIIAPIATVREYKDGGTLEVNRTQRGTSPERWDIRRWYKDENGNKCPGLGISLNDKELETLKVVLNEYC